MYSKAYWIGCDPSNSEALLAHYDANIVPAVQASDHHIGHHMIEAASGKWLLISNYHDQSGAEAAIPMVQELIKPMAENFGMTLEPIAEGEAVRII